MVELTAHGAVNDEVAVPHPEGDLVGVLEIGVVLTDVEGDEVRGVRCLAAGVEVADGQIGRDPERQGDVIALIGGDDIIILSGNLYEPVNRQGTEDEASAHSIRHRDHSTLPDSSLLNPGILNSATAPAIVIASSGSMNAPL